MDLWFCCGGCMLDFVCCARPPSNYISHTFWHTLTISILLMQSAEEGKEHLDNMLHLCLALPQTQTSSTKWSLTLFGKLFLFIKEIDAQKSINKTLCKRTAAARRHQLAGKESKQNHWHETHGPPRGGTEWTTLLQYVSVFSKQGSSPVATAALSTCSYLALQLPAAAGEHFPVVEESKLFYWG